VYLYTPRMSDEGPRRSKTREIALAAVILISIAVCLFCFVLGKLLKQTTEQTKQHVEACGIALEAAGAGIMKREPLSNTGTQLVQAGTELRTLSELVKGLAPDRVEAKDVCQRMQVAATKMIEAGTGLMGVPKPKATGKSWLKGGR